MANNGNDEEIIEKSSSEPVANACLILAAIALLGAMIFQIMEISEVRSTLTAQERGIDTPHARKASELTTAFSASVKKLLDENSHPELKLEGAAPETGGAAQEAKEAEQPAPEEKAEDKAGEKAQDSPGEAPAEEGTADEKPAEEKTAEEKPEAEPEKEAAPAKDGDGDPSK